MRFLTLSRSLLSSTFIFRKSYCFVATTWSVTKHFTRTKRAKLVRYCPRAARWKYMYVSHYAAKFESLVSKGILSSRNSRSPVWRLIVFESGSYRVPTCSGIFRRIRVNLFYSLDELKWYIYIHLWFYILIIIPR